MSYIPEQTIKDLEFDLIRLLLHDNCISDTAKLRMVDLTPITDFDTLELELKRLNDLKSIRVEGLPFPALDFEEIEDELETLENRHNVLPEESFFKIKLLSELINRILFFFSDKKSRFQFLKELTANLYHTDDLVKAINKVFDAKGKVKDDASWKKSTLCHKFI